MAYDANGFTTYTLAGDAIAVYVADDGNDANDGLTTSTPKLTIAAGYALLTSGKPDWLLLKRGSTFSTGLGHWRKLGRSTSEPMVIGTYGSAVARPILNTGTTSGMYREGGGGSPSAVNYVSVLGLHFTPNTYTGTGSPTGCSWLGPATGILIEDCVFDGYFNGITFQDDGTGGQTTVTVRRNYILNSYGNSGHSQGIYADDVTGLTIEENVVDNTGIDGTEGPTIYKHDLYIGTGNTSVKVLNNVLSRASSHGVQLRCGGTATGNVVIQCPLAILLGGGDPVSETHTTGVTGRVCNNVILEGTDITGALLRGYGIELTNIGFDGAIVADNVIANKTSTNAAGALILSADSYGSGVGCNNLSVARNTVYNWRGGISISAAAGSPPSPSTFTSQAGHVFIDNDIQSDIGADSATLVTTASGADPADFTWTGQNYYRASGGNEFTDEGVARAYAAWVTAAGETGSSNTQTTFPDTAKTLQGYVSIINGSALTFAQSIDRLAEQSIANWDERLRVQRIAAALRQGWIMATWLQETCTAIWAEGTRATLVGSPHAAGTTYIQNVCNQGWDEATRELTIPDAPTGVVIISAEADTAVVAWTLSATSGITRYIVRYGLTAGALNLEEDSDDVGTTITIQTDIDYGTWTPTGLTMGATYYFEIVAVNASGVESTPTTEDDFTLRTVVPVTGDRIYLTSGTFVAGANVDWVNAGNVNGADNGDYANTSLSSNRSDILGGTTAATTPDGTVIAWKLGITLASAAAPHASANVLLQVSSGGTVVGDAVSTAVPTTTKTEYEYYLDTTGAGGLAAFNALVAAGMTGETLGAPNGPNVTARSLSGATDFRVYAVWLQPILQGESGDGADQDDGDLDISKRRVVMMTHF